MRTRKEGGGQSTARRKQVGISRTDGSGIVNTAGNELARYELSWLAPRADREAKLNLGALGGGEKKGACVCR